MPGRLNRGRPAEAVSMAEGLASELAQARPVRLLLAQALSQLDRSDAAVQVLSQLVAEQPEDAEALALLGSLFKQRHFSGGGEADLQAALDHYRRAFTVSHQDLYLGRNLAQLLDRQGSPAAKAELASCLPELEALARHALDQPPVDYWTVQSALIIALLAGDAAAVEARLEQMLTLQPQSWMVEASIAELQGLRERSSDPARRERVDASIERLASSTAATEDDAEADDAQP